MSLAEAFRHQSISCAALGSPFMGQLFALFADTWEPPQALGAFFDSFTGDVGPAGHSLPLRLAGGLHALVLSGRAPALAALYPPETVSDAALRAGVSDAMTAHEDFLLDWVQSPPQTNEVRRAAALMAGAAEAARHIDLPVVLSELGASGGLNLQWDKFRLIHSGGALGPEDAVLQLEPDWTGAPPPATLPKVAARAGVDLGPLNPQHPDDLLRLSAYLWPDQPFRLALTRAAAAVQDTPVAKGDAIDWLETRLATAPEGHLHLIQHTVAWQYFPAEAQARGRALIEAAGAAATPQRALAWLAMESDGDTSGAKGARLTLTLWPGGQVIDLGRADFHGRWIIWDPKPHHEG